LHGAGDSFKKGFNIELRQFPMTQARILEKTEGGICSLTLYRPERLNAICVPMARNIAGTFKRISRNKSIRVVVLRGAGRAFSAGGDLKDIRSHPKVSGKIYNDISRYIHQTILTIAAMPQVVIAAVPGPAYGAGFGLALACDLVVASADATLCPSFINLALAPNAATTHLLPRILGPKRAMEAFLTAHVFSAKEAERLGIINHAWPKKVFERNLENLIRNILSRSPRTIQRIKKLLRSSLVQDLSRQLELERKEIAASARNPEFTKEIDAFFHRK
jgi:2-(1,2-epoxy-1,2-dihydrophenyl)acetyl-CoA isomerase